MREKIIGRLNFPPSNGLASDDCIIPSGLRMFDKKTNKFLRFLSAGISVDRFTYNLTKVLGDNISFIVFDNKGNFITSSDVKLESKRLSLPKALMDKGKDKVYKLDNQIEVESLFFTHMISSNKYPFKILVGQNHYYYIQQFRNELFSKVTLYILFGTLFSCIHYFLAFLYS